MIVDLFAFLRKIFFSYSKMILFIKSIWIKYIYIYFFFFNDSLSYQIEIYLYSVFDFSCLFFWNINWNWIRFFENDFHRINGLSMIFLKSSYQEITLLIFLRNNFEGGKRGIFIHLSVVKRITRLEVIVEFGLKIIFVKLNMIIILMK